MNADQVEGLVWGEVVRLLSEPDRLIRMAEDYLGLEGARAGVQDDQLAAIETRLAVLEKASTQRAVAALKAGLDPGTLRAAVSELEAEKHTLLAHRARLEHWRDTTLAEGDRIRRLQDLAASASERLGSMTPPERRAVLDLLDVHVTVTGWEPCRSCHGRGRVKGGRGGLPCRACRAMRRIPSFRIEGVVLDTIEPEARSAALARDAAIPFRLQLAAGS